MKKKFRIFAMLSVLLGMFFSAAGGAVGFAQETVPTSDMKTQSTGTLTLHALRNANGTGRLATVDNTGKEMTSGLPSNSQPLPGVKFNVAPISRDQAKAFGWSEENRGTPYAGGQNISQAEADAYFLTHAGSMLQETTDGNGKAVFNLTGLSEANPEANLFLVAVQDENVDGLTSAPEPFVVTVPSLNPEYVEGQANYYNYDVHIYPKFLFNETKVHFDKKGEGKTDPLVGAEFVIKKQLDNGEWRYLAADEKGNPAFDLYGDLDFSKANQEDANVYTFSSTKNGVEVTGLPVGHYAIEEKAKQSDTAKAGDMKDFLSNNWDSNKVEFDITQDDVTNNRTKELLEGKGFINYKKPEIDKKNDKKTVDLGERILFTLTPTIPGDIGEWKATNPTNIEDKAYVVVDKLDNRLSLEEYREFEELKVGNQTLYADKSGRPGDYYIAYDVTTRQIKWVFFESGREKLQKAYDEDGVRNLELGFYATPNENALNSLNEAIPNQGGLDFDNQYSDEKHDDTEVVYDVLGGARFKKQDRDSKKGLEGAEFVVQKLIKEGASDVPYFMAKDETGKVFWIDDEKDTRIVKLTSADDGTLSVEGLAYSNEPVFSDTQAGVTVSESQKVLNRYQLVETKAPNGYSKLSEPFEFHVGPASMQEGNVLEVPNAKHGNIPMTGSLTTSLLAIGGLILLVGGYIVYKRSEKHPA